MNDRGNNFIMSDLDIRSEAVSEIRFKWYQIVAQTLVALLLMNLTSI